MTDEGLWLEEFPVAITVTDQFGTIISMNGQSRKAFESDGGAALVGRSVFDCHPEPARTKTRELFERRVPNHYTIRKNGQKKIIHQIPWYRGGVFAGIVEISIAIPDSLPHLDRDQKP
jgi:transcriptional regulator with PAS, ATPase and Fis domain